MPDFAKIFTTGSMQGNTNSALGIFGKVKFLQKQKIHRVCTFASTLTPFFPLKKMAEIKKKRILEEKIQRLGYPKIEKSRLISSPFQIKNRIFFALFERFLVKIWARLKVKGSE